MVKKGRLCWLGNVHSMVERRKLKRASDENPVEEGREKDLDYSG